MEHTYSLARSVAFLKPRVPLFLLLGTHWPHPIELYFSHLRRNSKDQEWAREEERALFVDGVSQSAVFSHPLLLLLHRVIIIFRSAHWFLSLLSAFDFLPARPLRQWNISPWLLFAVAKAERITWRDAGFGHFLAQNLCLLLFSDTEVSCRALNDACILSHERTQSSKSSARRENWIGCCYENKYFERGNFRIIDRTRIREEKRKKYKQMVFLLPDCCQSTTKFKYNYKKWHAVHAIL